MCAAPPAEIFLIASSLNALLQVSVELMEPTRHSIREEPELLEFHSAQLEPIGVEGKPPSRVQAILVTAGEVKVLMQGEQHVLEEEKPLAFRSLAALKGLLHVLHVARGIAI